MAWIAGREDWQARCLREKRARKRSARGEDSLVRVLRRARTVGSSVGGGGVAGGEVAEGAMVACASGSIVMWCSALGRNLFGEVAFGGVEARLRTILHRYWLEVGNVMNSQRSASVRFLYL